MIDDVVAGLDGPPGLSQRMDRWMDADMADYQIQDVKL